MRYVGPTVCCTIWGVCMWGNNVSVCKPTLNKVSCILRGGGVPGSKLQRTAYYRPTALACDCHLPEMGFQEEVKQLLIKVFPLFNCISATAPIPPIELLASEMPASRSGRFSRPLPVTPISIGCYWLSAKKFSQSDKRIQTLYQWLVVDN